MKKSMIVTIVAGTLFVLFTMSIFLCAFLLLVPQQESTRASTCTVTQCNVYTKTCTDDDCYGSGKNRHCTTRRYTCYYPEAYMTFPYGDQIFGGYYTGSTSDYESFADRWCDDDHPINSTTACFFDIRDPGDTISLSEAGVAAGGIVAVVIFCVAAFAALITGGIAAYCWLCSGSSLY
eukprot:TRINITY_DN3285_c0_g1_i1.p1 TRINITY_DN3285_c0_g1~~TRINITY_DN3285_c0_g1_i1.p1  ORF type:complete len:178 (-),score=21.22 TRINITY_DN3285_c0_g1_i1:226-759(-)